jgi:hypothetical protein
MTGVMTVIIDWVIERELGGGEGRGGEGRGCDSVRPTVYCSNNIIIKYDLEIIRSKSWV